MEVNLSTAKNNNKAIKHYRRIVTHYLIQQDWQLADPLELTFQIVQDIETRELSENEVNKFIQTQVALSYASILYEILQSPKDERHERAWIEVKTWLYKNVALLTSDSVEQDEIVQETLINLQKDIPNKTLTTPRAFWAYLLQIMRNKRTDLHRRRSAAKRGVENVISLDEISEEPSETGFLEASIESISDPRPMEENVESKVIGNQLEDFFEKHISSNLQKEVAKAHFIDGLNPKEIASLLGKQPHEIRLIKARIVQNLRNLPKDIRNELGSIIGNINDKEAKSDISSHL